MHSGIQKFVEWVEANPEFPGLSVNPAASVADLAIIEDDIAAPLPEDLRFVLKRYNGGSFPSGQLLRAGRKDEDSVGYALHDLAQRLGMSPRDPELLLPFFRTDDGGLLAFDRSAGPVSDTWPIMDYYLDSGELRLIHRTFDGWCRARVTEWTADDFDAPFTLEKYLTMGSRHVDVEPDVSVAHATVAHALRRAGRVDEALASYLKAARCVPSQPWCDWEALKLAALVGNVPAALEAAKRLSSRAPLQRWQERDTIPSRVADVVGTLARLMRHREPLLRLFDQLQAQAIDAEGRAHVGAIRHAVHEGKAPPPTQAMRETAVPTPGDEAAWFAAIKQAYVEGSLRDEDLLLDPAYASLTGRVNFHEVLSQPRTF